MRLRFIAITVVAALALALGSPVAASAAPPTAAVTIAPSPATTTTDAVITVTFSEAVNGFDVTDVDAPNGTVGAFIPSNGDTVWTATFTPAVNTTDATNVVTVTLDDVTNTGGETGAGTVVSGNYAVDTARPTATIVVADPALTPGETTPVTITFSEAVTGFDNADLTVANGTLSTVTTTDDITWTATLTPAPGVTAAGNVITLDRAGVVDAAGNAGAGTDTSNAYAVGSPRPTATVVVADGTLTIGETSLVTFAFSEAVTGFANDDLVIEGGTLSAVSSADGGTTWTATLTPTANFTDAANVITVDLAGVTNGAGNTGTGTATSNGFSVDTARPTAAIVVADTSLTPGETSLVTITFSEAVTGFDNADLTVANGTLSTVTTTDDITWTATLTPTAGVTATTNVITLDQTGVADRAGNPGAGNATSNAYAVTTQRPTATIAVADTALSVGETSLVTITFSEAVTGFTLSDLAVENGTLNALSSSDGGITFTATLTPSAGVTDATNVITLPLGDVQNASGNAGVGSVNSANYAVDTQRPTATVVVADTALRIGETSLVTITFSEGVTGFSTADLAVENGTLGAVSSADGGITWTATLTPTAGVTDTANLITLANTGVADFAGNAGTGTTGSNNYSVDTVRPTATVALADAALTAGETTTVTVTFAEAVTGFTTADITVPNGTLSAPTSADGGITWTATLTPSAGVSDATNVISVNLSGVADLAGNAGTGSATSANYTVSTLRPTATVTISDLALTAGETAQITFAFSEAVSGFTNADLTIEGGTLTAVASTDGGVTYTATLTPAADTTDNSNVITLALTGVANGGGNAGTGNASSPNYTVDTTRPTGTVVVADDTLAAGETSPVTITFSEAVSGFDNADLAAQNGTLSAAVSTDGGVTFTATLTPTPGVTDASNVITLALAGVANGAGNAGTGTATSNNYAVTASPLTLDITVDDTSLTAGETSRVTFRFSRAVTGFTNADVTLSRGTLSAVTSADGGVTFTATFTPAANTTAAGVAITVDLAGVTDSASNTPGIGVAASNVFAVDTAVAGPVARAVRVLAATGADLGGALAAGVLLLMLGAALVVARRRRA